MSGTTIIHGTYDYEVQSLTLDLPKVPDRTLNQSQFTAWQAKTALNKQDKAILKTIGKNLQYISYGTFSEGIRSCVTDFQKTAPAKYVSFVEPEKSQTWVTGIAVSQGLAPTMYLRMGEQGADMLSNTLADIGKANYPTVGDANSDIVRDIVIVDDGAFTGNQMSFNISSATRIMEKFFGHSRNPYHFHVIVPYMTAQADSKIRSAIKSGAKVHLYKLKDKMPVLSDVFQQKDLKRAGKLLEVIESRVNSTALTYFDHKIPNSMSFPGALARGGFIPTDESPYKLPPYVLE